MEHITRRQWEHLENRLNKCPFCDNRVFLIRSDGGDCRYSRECCHGFYVKCWHCQLMFGYEPNRGGIYRIEDLDKLVRDWCEGTARPRRVIMDRFKVTPAAARINAGLTQAEAAEKLKLTPSKLSMYETGLHILPLDTQKAMARLYRLALDQIKEVGK